MTDAPVADARRGHNKPPVTAPFDTDLLEDLKYRYPNLQTKFDELISTAATIPEKIEDEETAGKVQELLRSMADALRRWKADRTAEKGPWAKLADIAYNFFKDKEDKLSPVEKQIKARHTDYLDHKVDAELRRREELAEQMRQDAERKKKEAEEAEMDRLWAEAHKELAEWEEAAAIKRAQEAEQRKRDADAAAAAAAERAKQAEAERKAREKIERDKNAENLKQIRGHMKIATRLHEAGLSDETAHADIDQLDALVRPGGIIGVLAAQVFGSTLLDHEEVLEIEQVRLALGNMRQVLEERLDAKARRKREKERKAQEAADAKAAAEREEQRKAHQAATAAALAAKEKAEAEAAAAKQEAASARKDAREATKDANEAAADVKEASRDAAQAVRGAEKADARAGRAERQVEGASDADLSRTRSELGTMGSLRGRWTHVVEDDRALTAYFGPLGRFLSPETRAAAVYHYMRENQANFTETPTRTEVPGVFFENVPESQVR